MASSFFALFDDIAMLADDVAVMSKVAAKKTVGVLSDDVALNANQVSGFSPSRELPVVLAVAKGSAINKAIIVPLALLLVAFAPWSITPILMLGGAYLCFEGVEKVFHTLFHSASEDEAHHKEIVQIVQHTPSEILALEKEKIRGAVRTDGILSAEIIAISLGTMQGAPLSQQAISLVIIAIAFTIGVYAVVAGIVKLDDLGMYLSSTKNKLNQFIGKKIVSSAPYLMRTLSFVGVLAMFLVGGGIISHGIPAIHHLTESVVAATNTIPGVGPVLAYLAPSVIDMGVGLIVGAVVLGGVSFTKKLFHK